MNESHVNATDEVAQQPCIGCTEDTGGRLACCEAPCCEVCFNRWLEQSSFCMHCRRQIDPSETRRPRTDDDMEEGELPRLEETTEVFYQNLMQTANRYMPPNLTSAEKLVFQRGFIMGTINGISVTDTMFRFVLG